MKKKLATLALTGLMVFAFASSSFATVKIKPNKALSNVTKRRQLLLRLLSLRRRRWMLPLVR